MMKDGTPDVSDDGQSHWLHFSVLVHPDSGYKAEAIADAITGEVGVQSVYQLYFDGFGHLVRTSEPIA